MTIRLPSLALLAAALLGITAGADAQTGGAAAPTASPEPPHQRTHAMRMNIKVGDKVISATFADNETARDFASLLPLTLTMNDLFRREKFAHLPRPILTAGPRSRTYQIGDVILWSPGPDVAIYYRHDGQNIPAPGVILIANVNSDIETIDVPGVVNVTFTAVKD